VNRKGLRKAPGTFLNLVTKDDLAAVQAQIDVINATLTTLQASFKTNNLVARVTELEKQMAVLEPKFKPSGKK
jgi:hypothetical protein